MIVEQYNSGNDDLPNLVEEELRQQEEPEQEDEFQFQEENSFEKWIYQSHALKYVFMYFSIFINI